MALITRVTRGGLAIGSTRTFPSGLMINLACRSESGLNQKLFIYRSLHLPYPLPSPYTPLHPCTWLIDRSYPPSSLTDHFYPPSHPPFPLTNRLNPHPPPSSLTDQFYHHPSPPFPRNDRTTHPPSSLTNFLIVHPIPKKVNFSIFYENYEYNYTHLYNIATPKSA